MRTNLLTECIANGIIREKPNANYKPQFIYYKTMHNILMFILFVFVIFPINNINIIFQGIVPTGVVGILLYSYAIYLLFKKISPSVSPLIYLISPYCIALTILKAVIIYNPYVYPLLRIIIFTTFFIIFFRILNSIYKKVFFQNEKENLQN